MPLTKEDLNQIKSIVREIMKEELEPLEARLTKVEKELRELREEFKIKFSELKNEVEDFKYKTHSHFELHMQLMVEMKSEIKSINRYLVNDYKFADRSQTSYRTIQQTGHTEDKC